MLKRIGLCLGLLIFMGSAFADWSHYALVLFYESTCPHCQRFTPIVAAVAAQQNIKLYAFTLNGGTLPAVAKDTAPANPDIVNNFYQNAPSHEVPAVFLVNVNTMAFLPVSVGEEPEGQFVAQVQEAYQAMEQGQ